MNYKSKSNTGKDIEAAQDTLVPGIISNLRISRIKRKGSGLTSNQFDDQYGLYDLPEKRT